MAKPKSNTKQINVFLSEQALTEIKEEANKKGTSVSGLIRMIVLEYLSKKK